MATKVLIVHNFYRSDSPSGENILVEQEAGLVASSYEVDTFYFYSDKLNFKNSLLKVLVALLAVVNPIAILRFIKCVRRFRPDVIHIHNLFPFIGYWVLFFKGKSRVVYTLHNYRFFCVSGLVTRNDKPCVKCLKRNLMWYGVLHKCYRNSYIASLIVLVNNLVFRVFEVHRLVDVFIVLTNFQKDVMADYGIPREKIIVKPNPVEFPKLRVKFDCRCKTVLFVGRLSEEKGIVNLINSWKKCSVGERGFRLRVLGDGPLRDLVTEIAQCDPTIIVEGAVKPSDVKHAMSNSYLLVVPSRWFEGFPMVIREAISAGTPFAVTDIGGLPEIAREFNGFVIEGDLADFLEYFCCGDDVGAMDEMSQKIYSSGYDKLESRNNLKILGDIYG